MPINKKAYLRLRTIDTLLAGGVRYTKAEILDKIQEEVGFEVSPFTFDKDLQLLRGNLRAPIEYSKRGGYYYSSKDFKLFSSALSDEDVEALEFASDALNTLNVELAQEAQTVLMSIYARAKKEDSKPRKQIIFRPTSQPVKGLEWLSVLYKAIDEETAIVIKYYKLQTGKTNTRTISPYILRQYNELWYVIAWCAARELTLVFALDRIREISPAHVNYYKDPKFDPEQYFKYSFGITHSYYDQPQKVTFWISKEAYYYLQVRPLHASQKTLKEKDGGFIVEIEVIISEELVMALRGLGRKILAISPDNLIKRIKDDAS